MKTQTTATRVVSLVLAGSVLMASCASTTVIQSEPNGAKVYLNGEPVGRTPYTHRDSKIVGSTTYVKLEKDGYETLNTSFSRDEEVDAGAIVGGIFFLFPFLWTMKYKPVRTYELVPGADFVPPMAVPQPQTQVQPLQVESKATRLRELKQLLDENIITQEEYEKEKKKILEEDEN